jgi:hypothetical protein
MLHRIKKKRNRVVLLGFDKRDRGERLYLLSLFTFPFPHIVIIHSVFSGRVDRASSFAEIATSTVSCSNI